MKASADMNTAQIITAQETDKEEHMKLTVIYDSKTGNTRQAAEWIAEGMNQAENTEAKAFSIHDIDEDFVKECTGIVIGSPSYAAQLTPDLHAWMLASGGGSCGMPVIHLGPVGVNNNVEKHNGMECYKDNFIVFGARFAKKAAEIF